MKPTPRWLVRTGEMEEIIEAQTPDKALVGFFDWLDKLAEPPELGEFVSVVRIEGDQLWMATDELLRRLGRLENTSALSASKSSIVTT